MIYIIIYLYAAILVPQEINCREILAMPCNTVWPPISNRMYPPILIPKVINPVRVMTYAIENCTPIEQEPYVLSDVDS